MESTTSPPTGSTPPNRLITGAHEAVDKFAAAASQASERLQEGSEKLRKVQSDVSGCCRSYVKDHPALSLGTAIAIGFLVRHLIRPR